MKKILAFSLFSITLGGCGSYNYYPHTVNSGFFANKGEVQAGGYMGIAGFSTTGGVAVTDKISVMGMYAGNPGEGGYHDKEGELSMGFNNGHKDHAMMYGLCGGYGFGSNYKQDSGSSYKSFNGSFQRPFITASLGRVSTRNSGIRADASLALRFNYLMYYGDKNGGADNFDADHFYYEFYYRAGIGGKHVRFDIGTGFAFKNLSEAGHGAKIFPMHLNFGLTFIFGRTYEE
jgi:hypothetical protein